MVVRSAVALLLLTIAWLCAGRRFTLALDRALTVQARSLPVSPLRYDGGGWVIGGLAMTFGAANNLRYDLALSVDSANRVILSAGQSSFLLGPRTSPEASGGRPEIDFRAEPGDDVSFRVSQSLLPWPTPFEFQFLGGPSPWWKRYVYYRLAWKKLSGRKLEMNWRYEKQWYSRLGWSAPQMMWNSQTGLLSVRIDTESGGAERAVVDYITRTKGWHRGQYRVERLGPDVLAVIYRADERSPHPGGGQSIELRLDRFSRRVVREVGWQ